MSERMHKGDPCIRCGIPHDKVPSGPCRGFKSAYKVGDLLHIEYHNHKTKKKVRFNGSVAHIFPANKLPKREDVVKYFELDENSPYYGAVMRAIRFNRIAVTKDHHYFVFPEAPSRIRVTKLEKEER